MRRQILISAAMMLALSCSQGGKVDFPEPPDGYTLLLARTEAIGLGTSSHDASWESGARIGVFGSKSGNNAMYVLKKAGTGKTEAEFYGPLVSGSEVSAVYPYSEGYAASASAFPVKIPHEQALDTEKSMAEHFLSVCGSAFAFLDAGILRFHYPLGMLAVRFELESPIVVNSMMLKSMAAAFRKRNSLCRRKADNGQLGLFVNPSGLRRRNRLAGQLLPLCDAARSLREHDAER